MTTRFKDGVGIALMAVAVALAGSVVGCAHRAGDEASVSPRHSLRAATPPSAEPEVADEAPSTRLSNTLRWTTASEVDNFGFDVFRGDTEDGPFERITERPVAGAGNSDLPTDYAYVDATIDPAREYFYYVESISMSGERLRFTPIMRAPAKK